MSASIHIGAKFNRLTVVGKVYIKGKRKYVPCVCECGNTNNVREDSLKSYERVSCGCFRVEKLRDKVVTHGMTNSKTYSTWEGMLQRCNNYKSSGYSNYGGRGITICDRWLDFSNFYEDMGERPEGMSLDRIDVNGNYCKDNCKWSDASEQSFNTRLCSNNTSGRTGVSWSKAKCLWESYIMKDRKKINLGRFQSFEDAVKAREQAEIKYFGRIKEI